MLSPFVFVEKKSGKVCIALRAFRDDVKEKIGIEDKDIFTMPPKIEGEKQESIPVKETIKSWSGFTASNAVDYDKPAKILVLTTDEFDSFLENQENSIYSHRFTATRTNTVYSVGYYRAFAVVLNEDNAPTVIVGYNKIRELIERYEFLNTPDLEGEESSVIVPIDEISMSVAFAGLTRVQKMEDTLRQAFSPNPFRAKF